MADEGDRSSWPLSERESPTLRLADSRQCWSLEGAVPMNDLKLTLSCATKRPISSPGRGRRRSSVAGPPRGEGPDGDAPWIPLERAEADCRRRKISDSLSALLRGRADSRSPTSPVFIARSGAIGFRQAFRAVGDLRGLAI